MRSFDFEITCIILDQIALHSVQLHIVPLCIVLFLNVSYIPETNCGTAV